jgi:hypothetical protein
MRLPLLVAAVTLASAPAVAQDGTAVDVSVETIISRLQDAAGPRRAPVRLYYRASSCEGLDRPDAMVFRPIAPLTIPMRPLQPRESVAASIRDMFGETNRVQVTEDRGGLVRVTIDDPPAALLQSPVSLRLTIEERYNGNLAVIALETSRDFRAARERLGMQQPVIVGSWLFTMSRSGPALPRRFRNVTADAFLDQVARAFHKLIVYSVCPDGRTYFIDETTTDPRVRA